MTPVLLFLGVGLALGLLTLGRRQRWGGRGTGPVIWLLMCTLGWPYVVIVGWFDRF